MFHFLWRTLIFLVFNYVLWTCTLKITTFWNVTPYTLIDRYYITRRHIPEDSNVYSHQHCYLKPHNSLDVLLNGVPFYW